MVHTSSARVLLDISRIGEHVLALALLRRLRGEARRAVRDMVQCRGGKEGEHVFKYTFESEEDTLGYAPSL